ncbi:MAG: phosphoglycerate dehydrogenase [Vampirovibrionales bacterium]
MMMTSTSQHVKPKVLITDGINPIAVNLLKETCEVIFEPKLSPEALLEKVKEVDGLMVRSASQVTEAVFQAAPSLKIVGRAGVGTDNIDVAAATRAGAIVLNSPEGNTIAAAEHTVAMVFALSRHVPEGDATLKAGKWERSKLVGNELFGKTLGLIGMGKIGSRAASILKAAGMKVLAFDPFASKQMAESLGFQLVESLEDIWATADIITLHVPKTAATQNMVNASVLAKCKKGVKFVNCARGGLVDEQALADAIVSGHVAGAAFDVFSQEPVNPENPLLALGNRVVLTPHLGASTEEAQVNVAIDVAEQMKSFFSSGFCNNAVNMPVMKREVIDPVKHYMSLAEMLGRTVAQLAPKQARFKGVTISYEGSLSQRTFSPLTLTVLKGLLSHTREGVNYVNARMIAEDELHLHITETTRPKVAEGYRNQVLVELHLEQGDTITASATLVSEGISQFTSLKGFRAVVEPSAEMLLVPHQDVPGAVAKVTSLLGHVGVNISGMTVARLERETSGGASIMVFNLDTPVTETLLEQIEKLPGIEYPQALRLVR